MAACLSLLAVLAFASCLSTGEVTYPASGTLLPGVLPAMNSPGYWIDGLAWADRVMVSGEAINQYNTSTRNRGLTRDLADWKAPDAASLTKDLEGTVKWLSKQELYCPDGRKVDALFLDPLREYMDLKSIHEPGTDNFALLTGSGDLRVLPTIQGLFDGPRDWFIDNLQASSLEPGDACVVQHASKDGLWSYVTTAFASGWVETRWLALCSRDEYLAWKAVGPAWVVTAARADCYDEPTMIHHRGSLRMGTWVLPADQAQAGPVALKIPGRDTLGHLEARTIWIDREDVSDRPLDGTLRMVLRQAFRLLNAPYGWGGTFGQQDCSQFLQEIYSTLGLVLPRNSAAQAKTGQAITGFSAATPPDEKYDLLARQGVPGFTMLRMPGHIMLFLGCRDHKVWTIHATWAYREPWQGTDRIRLINRVTVSSLDLGTGSSKGSHLSRLTHAMVIGPFLTDLPTDPPLQ